VLAAEEAIEADADDDATDEGGDVHVGDLAAGIEGGENQQPGEAAGEAGRDDFRGNENRAPRTPMPFVEVPMAARTGCH
jgi:hypothetical protein